MPQMISKVATANCSDRRVSGDNLLLYNVVSSSGRVKIGPSNIYEPFAGAVTLQLVCGVHYKSSGGKLWPLERVLCSRRSLKIFQLCD